MNKYLFLSLSFFVMMFCACKKDTPADPVTPVDPIIEDVKPIITSIQPKDPKAGDVVILKGESFGTTASDIKLAIGTKTLTIASVNETEIRFTIPADVSEGLLSLIVKGIQATVKDPEGATIKPKPEDVPVTPVDPKVEEATLEIFEELKTHAYFAANDHQGNFYTLNTVGAGLRYYKLLRIDATGKITKTFEVSDFGYTTPTLVINGITNDSDGTIWIVTALEAGSLSRSEGKLFKLEKGKDKPEFVRDVIGKDNATLRLTEHFYDFVVNSKKEVFFIDNQYKIFKVPASGIVELYINGNDLITGINLLVNGLSVDQNDNIFFTGVNSTKKVNRIYQISPLKEITALYQSTETGFADGALAESKFTGLASIAVNLAGTHLYIADPLNYRIRMLDLTTSTVTTVAGNGKNISIGNDLKLNGSGPALMATTAPAKLSLSETKKILYIQSGNDNWYQLLKF